MISFPPCKINLGLHILKKRSDHYHDLDTCFYTLPFTDVLEVIPDEELKFFSTGVAIPGNESDNLCLKAYKILSKDFPISPVAIHLHKVIPVGAGLGGGSSDAAHTLRLLNAVFKLTLTQQQLHSYASLLGSDCSFFIQDNPMIGTGRGEILTPSTLSLEGKYLVLLKPDIHVSTAEAYSGCMPRTPTLSVQQIIENKDLATWCDFLKNDFEQTVFARYPIINSVKKSLYDLSAVYASMSGSGSAVFGIFDKERIFTANDFTVPLLWQGKLS